MKTFQLEGKGREVAATSADQKRALKAMRKNQEIPAVLYGGEKVTHFTVNVEGVRKLVYTPEIFAVELNIDGKKTTASTVPKTRFGRRLCARRWTTSLFRWG